MDGGTVSPSMVGIVLLGHANTASGLLDAASGIVSGPALSDVVAVDAGVGETPGLSDALCAAIERADSGRGVLMIVDLMGSSPCNCGRRESSGRDLIVLSGLNLAMLLKLASLDRTRLSASELADACAESGRKAVSVAADEGDENGQ